MNYKFFFSLFLLNIIAQQDFAQNYLDRKHIAPFVFHFDLTEDARLIDGSKQLLNEKIGAAQFVGLAEVHQSAHLSYFTASLLPLLAEKGFRHMALELGPFSAEILQDLSRHPEEVAENLRKNNRKYGKKAFIRVPLIFVDKKEDAVFVKKAAELGYNFWGLDQEFALSYLMHIDRLYEMAENPPPELTNSYQSVVRLLKQKIFRHKSGGLSINCWFLRNKQLKCFYSFFNDNPKAKAYIRAIRLSQQIYCKQETGTGGSQQRADYMKKNFEDYFDQASDMEDQPKVFVKLGGVHLTRGNSIFGIEDVGKYLHDKSACLQSEFVTIRHYTRFWKGRDKLRSRAWQSVRLLNQFGKKDQWTLIDLRPLREKLASGELQADREISFEIGNYDLILIPPDDRKGKVNF